MTRSPQTWNPDAVKKAYIGYFSFLSVLHHTQWSEIVQGSNLPMHFALMHVSPTTLAWPWLWPDLFLTGWLSCASPMHMFSFALKL